LLSPSCGFATDSTILEMQQARMLGAARIFGGAKQARMPKAPGRARDVAVLQSPGCERPRPDWF
jgi:hypothetical protein